MARPKILVFQHVPYEPLGTLDPLLKEAGFRIRYVNFGRDPHQRPSLEKYEALIVLGGPMNAHQIDTYPNLVTEVDVIREAVDTGMSVLGICLGAQLLAKAVGGRVSRNAEREIGWHDVQLTEAGVTDPVISSFSSTQEVFQWHEDGITLPAGAQNLATSPASKWLTVPANQPMLEDEAGRVDPHEIRLQTNDRIGALQTLSRKTFSRWIDRFEIAPRRCALPSR
jgi:GMP synthase (glutamine-hydrolysing)